MTDVWIAWLMTAVPPTINHCYYACWRQGDDSVFLTAPDIDEPTLIGGDIAIKSEADRNADPCTSRGCMWGKWSDGKVYVPYYIANHYCKYFLFFLIMEQANAKLYTVFMPGGQKFIFILTCYYNISICI